MKIIDLSQEIDNDSGYVDTIIDQIRAAKGEDLQINICTPGGDVFQGSRIAREILVHDKTTKALVVGVAASMGGVLLSAFDKVEIDSDAEIMLHKSRIYGVKESDYTPEQKDMCDRFNNKAYTKMKTKGVDAEFLDKVFNSEQTNDHWLTAYEAEKLGIGKVVEVDRKSPLKMVAKLDSKSIYNEYQKNKMGIFDKKKSAPQLAKLADGATLVFNSIESELKKGDAVSLVGSVETLNGKYKLTDKITLVVNNGVVEAMEEEEVKDEEGMTIEQLAEMIQTLATKVSEIEEKVNGSEAPSAEMDEEKEEIKAALKNFEEKETALNSMIEAALKVTNTLSEIKGNFIPPKMENKHETVMTGLSSVEQRAREMRETLTETKLK